MTYYYELSLLNSPLENLTYEYNHKIDIGSVVEVSLGNRKKSSEAVILKEIEKPNFKTKEISSIKDEYYFDFEMELAKFINNYYVCSFGEAISIFIPHTLKTKRVLDSIEIDSSIELSNKQTNAYEFINNNKVSLLFADTGSGKTEIYIKMIEKALKESKEVVLLMPEISLTPQMEKRLKSIFGDLVAIWHSRVTKPKKKKIIDGLNSGEIRVVAGARSSLFLPFNNLGLIIVDEEHDESYKSDSKPRINVKDLSVYIGNKYDIKVILGSATPSITSFYKVPYFRLDETFFESSKSIIYEESEDFLSKMVLDKIDSGLKNSSQSILFLPTRANFKYQICFSCGKAVECPYCSVSMSLHKNDLALRCHYCGYAERIPEFCPSCKTGIIHNLRVGTAQINDTLKTVFTDAKIEKFDRDSIKTDKQLRDILKRFNDEDIDILVGTQMLSKGHDYHNVKLSVVIGIDSILSMNSYRSREKALSLVMQLAGRSGRKGFGEVIIQTKNREFFEYYLDDYKRFLDDELSFREELYPPFRKIAKVIFAHTNATLAKKELEFYKDYLKNFKEVELIGSGESTIFKIANKYRYEMLLRSSSVSKLLSFLHSIKSNIAIIDMDSYI